MSDLLTLDPLGDNTDFALNDAGILPNEAGILPNEAGILPNEAGILPTTSQPLAPPPRIDNAVVGEGLRSHARGIAAVAKGQPMPWSQAGIITALSFLLVLAVTGIIISVLALIKSEYDEHRTLPRGPVPSVTASVGARFVVDGKLFVGNDLTVGNDLSISGDLDTATLVCTNYDTPENVSVAGVNVTSALVRAISNFRRFVSIGQSGANEYKWAGGVIPPQPGSLPMPNLDVFTTPWIVLDGDDTLYSQSAFTNTEQKTIAWLELPPGYWAFTFQCQYAQPIGDTNLTPSIVVYTEKMENVLINGENQTDSALVMTQVPENVFLQTAWVCGAINIPATNAFMKSSALRPMVEFAGTSNESAPVTSSFTLGTITFTCIQLS